jgi:hypothetical protein
MKRHLLTIALASARSTLAASPAALVAIGIAAGMAAPEAKAWGSQYESLGRTIGSELGRSAAGGGYGAGARIAGLIGETIGTNVGKPMDESSEAQRRDAENIQRAKEQAVRDAAYDAERRRLDPSYVPASSYGDMVRRSADSSSSYNAVGANLRALNERTEAAVQEYTRRNAPKSR